MEHLIKAAGPARRETPPIVDHFGEIEPNARSLRNRTVSARPQNPRPQKRRRVDNVQSNATIAAGITGAEGRAEQHVMEGDVSV